MKKEKEMEEARKRYLERDKKGKTPFVCSVAGCTFIIRYNQDHELHIFTCKDDPKLNWQEKVPSPAPRGE